ncbi:MAG: hypothetical protein LJE74_04990 [Proteobacteria bacterium]|jgi:hypothetical protein|nr:hypothetical protein [Pseudomonadota bacterium]
MIEEDKDKPGGAAAASPTKKKASKKKTVAKKKSVSKKTTSQKSTDTSTAAAAASTTASAASSADKSKREKLNEKLHDMGVMPDSKKPKTPAAVPLSGMIMGSVVILVIIILSLYVWYERRDATQATAQQPAPMYPGMAGPAGANGNARHPMMAPGPWGPYTARGPVSTSDQSAGNADGEAGSATGMQPPARPDWANRPNPPERPDWVDAQRRAQPPARPGWASRPPVRERPDWANRPTPPERPDWVEDRPSQPPARPDWATRPPVWEPVQRPDWANQSTPPAIQERAGNGENAGPTLPRPPYRGWGYQGYPGYPPYYGPGGYPPHPYYW